MDPIKVDFTGKGKSSGKKTVIIPPENARLKLIISIIGTVIFAAVAFYIMLPPLNIKAKELYYYIGLVIASFIALIFITSKALTKPEYTPYVKKVAVVPIILAVVIALVAGVGVLASSVFFRARSYSELITVDTNGKFDIDIDETDFNSVPKLDESAAMSLANRALSDLANENLVSQFTIQSSIPQINYDETPVRVAPLKYASIIKWFTNRTEGLPGYIIIDMAAENTRYVALEEGMKYSPVDHFSRLLSRHLRFAYPTFMFEGSTFEVDEDGHPYWICARIDKTIGLFGGRDIIGAVLVDAVTGESNYYTVDELTNDANLMWIDRVFSAQILVEQYDHFGSYRSGFWNSILGQKNVIQTTEGYNYLAINDDVLLYTGVTSVTSDQSIIGFVLINQRTKEAVYYRVNGAKEYSAMETAEGLVKDYGFNSTFPLLVNVADEPTYFMALKDASNVVQRYSMINVKQYNKIKTVGETLGECLESYINVLEEYDIRVNKDDIDIPDDKNDIQVPEPDNGEKQKQTVTGVVEDIRSAVLDGGSYYFIKLEQNNAYYSIKASASPEVVILNKGQNVQITFEGDEKTIIPAIKLSVVE